MNTANQGRRSWHAGVTRYQWTVLVIASLGWVFDVFQGQLFAVYKTPAMTAVLGPLATAADVDRYANMAFASFLAGGALGGLFFGMLADRIGRRQSMVWSILVYSVFSGLHYFANTCWQIVALRFLVAIGVGGEWAVAAALVSEVFTGKARTMAGGIFHASALLARSWPLSRECSSSASIGGRGSPWGFCRRCWWSGCWPALRNRKNGSRPGKMSPPAPPNGKTRSWS